MTGVALAETGAPKDEGRDRPRRRAWVRFLGTPDGRAVLVLVAVPLAVFVIPALAGHAAIAGDNLIQNFPLRALSGRQLGQGHLPLWNPYIWSGSPLLGGLNAGSFYPFTFVFAVLSPIAAWVVNLLAVYWAAGLGLYALGRQYGLRPLACLLAGLSYAFAGTMSGQMVHLGVVQGMGWAPLLVLAQLRLSWAVLGRGPAPADGTIARAPAGATGTGSAAGAVGAPIAAPSGAPAGAPLAVPTGAPGRSSPWPWVVLLAAMIGFEALTGEPRAMAETEVVAAVVTVWLVLRPYRPVAGLRPRLAFVGLSALAGLWGVALAAAELAPGWSFIRASQRAVESYSFFGSGSLPVKWSALLFVPDLFGGAGRFEQPTYFNHYNLPELTGYLGLLALGAAVVLLTRSFGRRRDPAAGDWGLWLGLLVLGLFLAWGYYTPLGHLWAHIPLFGKTRLQSRNLGIVDLALAVLLAFWADRALGGRLEAAGLAGWRRWAVVAPALVSAGLCVAVLAAPVPVEEWFGANATGGTLAHYLVPWLIAQLVVAGAVVVLVLGWPRLSRRDRHRGLAAVVCVDLLLFGLATGTAMSYAGATPEPSPGPAETVLGTAGRFAIYQSGGAGIATLSVVGQPDLNAFTRMPSVQGYGSILSDSYGTATGSHTLDNLTGCALARGVFAPLRLATVLVAPGGLAPGISSSVATGAAPVPAPPACPGAAPDGTAGQRTLYLGFPLDMTAATLVAAGGRVPRTPLVVGVLGEGGATRRAPASVHRTRHGWSVRFAHPVTGYGLVVQGPAHAVSEASTVTGHLPPAPGPGGEAAGSAAATPAPAPGHWAFDGVLQQALAGGGWRYTGMWQGYARFRHAVGPPVWLAGAPAGAAASRVRTTDWGTEVDTVTADRPVTLVRSEAYLAGWRAVAVPAGGGPGRDLPVVAHGLVQAVRLPAGSWTVTFRYRAPHLTGGLAASALGLAAIAGAGAWALVLRRRRRRAR